MDFSFTEEQSMLGDTLASFLRDKYDFETRRGIVRSESGWRPDYWKAFAQELGILGAPFPEALGGLGGGPIENMIVMESFGKALVVEPYLGTVVIAGGFLKHSGHAGAAELIGGIIQGDATFAFAYAEPQARYAWRDLKTTARRDGGGYVLNGHKAVVVGAPWASHLIVTARTGGGQREAGGVSVFLVDRTARGVITRDYPTIDGLRASEVFFENVALGAEALIGGEGAGLPLVERVMDEATAATCGEAVGVLRGLLEQTLDYTKQRQQFGQPIGRFQVLQHRMVDMFIQIEQAVSLTTVASLKLDGSDQERGKAVSAAKAHVGRACRFVGQNAIQLHGGMGMTEEMAVGHYFKRATIIEGLFGSVDHHLRRYADLSHARPEPRQAAATDQEPPAPQSSMDLSLSPGDLAFREEVRAFIAESFDDDMRARMAQSKNGHVDHATHVRWFKRLYARGWAAPDWPVEYGGTGWSDSRKYIFNMEMALAGTPMTSGMGIRMCAPVIMAFGSDEQKKRHLPPTLSHDVWWCQGYSEPGSGSDLASLSLKAERNGEDYVLNGSKLWTTHAQWADWMFCLVRTNPGGRPQEGISFLLLDMKSPGIIIRPLPTIDGPVDGEQEVNQVYFENVRVPIANRVGEEGQGWTYAKYLLQFERGHAFGPGLVRGLQAVKAIAAAERSDSGESLASDADFRRKLAEVEIYVEAINTTEIRLFAGHVAGESIGPVSSMFKLEGSKAQQAISELALEAVGVYAQPFVQDTWAELSGVSNAPRPGPDYAAPVTPTYLNYRKVSIYAGSNEIQHNIMAKTILGL